MKILGWFTPIWLTPSWFSESGRAMSLYKRGMAKAKKRDHEGAIADYSRTIEMRVASAELTSMVLYNRALVYVASGEKDRGLHELKQLLEMPGVLQQVKTKARQKLSRMASREK